MATVKRRAVTDDRPGKKAKLSAVEMESTRSKVRESHQGDKARKRLEKSILRAEEPAFPRGGGSILTPVEQKQINAKAERDALFEQETGQPAEAFHDDGDLVDEEAFAAPTKKKRKLRRDSDENMRKVLSSSTKIQSLSYKTLIVGSTVLGCVTAVTMRDVALALPNNLTGYAPITAVSQILSKRIEKLLAEEEAQIEDDDSQDVDLKQLFFVGQWLRAVVTATGAEGDGASKSKRHIELSLDPFRVNGSLDAETVVIRSVVQATVRSVEDHGVVMDVGLSDPTVKGFLSKKDLGAAFNTSDLLEGQVMLCLVTGKASNGKVLKLSPDPSRFAVRAGDKNAPTLSEAPTVDTFLPGTAIDVLVTESGPGGVAGKVMGMVDVTADVLHSGASAMDADMTKECKIGSKIKGRIIFTLPTDDGNRKTGISLLTHLLALLSPSSSLPENAGSKARLQARLFEDHLPISSTVEDATVIRVLPERGLFLQLKKLADRSRVDVTAFAHISQISDNRIDSLSSTSGNYKLGSTHRIRIVSFNPIDNLYYVSLKKSVLDQAFLRLEDVMVGAVVKGTVQRLILGGRSGISGVLVKLSSSITGLVPDIHLSDVQLEHPERKFKEGYPVTARVLSVDLDRRQARLTLKKTLINDDRGVRIWKDYAALKPGMEGKGVIVNLLPAGAVVQFFGNVRAWLPVAEMSDTYVEKPEEYFRLGQTINVRILSVNPEAKEMKVSCKDGGTLSSEDAAVWEQSSAGDLVSGAVTMKSNETVALDLENGLRGTVRLGHLSDRPISKAENTLKHIRVGQKLSELVILQKLVRSKSVLLSRKRTLVEDAKANQLVESLANLKTGIKVHGFVRNVTPEGVYVEFANGLVGLMPKSQVPIERATQPAFGLSKDQSLSAWVMGIDATRQRFTLTMREQTEAPCAVESNVDAGAVQLQNPVDPSLHASADIKLGMVTKARIASIKATQVNVRLADNVQGRIDMSEVFDSWDDIANKKAPLQKFKLNDVLDAKVLGIHDTRHHRFLPISHRQSTVPVFELSAKKSRLDSGDENLLSMQAVQVNSDYLAFVNNYGDDCVWVNLSPNVRGRVALLDLSNDAGQLQNMKKTFPIGCAIQVKVKNVSVAANRLDLTARAADGSGILSVDKISPGAVMPARVTKVSDFAVTVQLSDDIAAPIPLVELSDDYDQANPGQYKKNDIVRVCVIDVDVPNKKPFFSMRPSKVLSSSLSVKDRHIMSPSQLKSGDIVRGFIKFVGDKGIIVSLGARVQGFVRISDLSDQFVKDWKSLVQVDQLVKGRILEVEADSKHIQISLKASHVDANYQPPLGLSDLAVGMIVSGKVRKVEDFGAFIDIDNTRPRLSGLCHRSEVASKRVEDVRKLYREGDLVKAKILGIERDARKISLGLKASYFVEDHRADDSNGKLSIDVDDISGDEAPDRDNAMADAIADINDPVENQLDLNLEGTDEGDRGFPDAGEDELDDGEPSKLTSGLRTPGFDWNADGFRSETVGTVSESETETMVSKKRKRHRPEIKHDLTGDLDKYGPRSGSDFERQLLGQPNDSGLWIQYMAFQLQVGEVQKARDLAERALRTIHIRETDEKRNIWIARMNLELEYGDGESVEEVLKQACQLQDPLEMHEKLASIYIDSGKHDQADAIFERMVANKAFRASPEIWLNYASFLMTTLGEPSRARALLSRALQSVPMTEHRLLTAKFAALELRSVHGDPERGRTIFESLTTEWPKWSSGWDMWVDLERARNAHLSGEGGKAEASARVRGLYERIAAQKMKKRRAKFVFKRWLEFEQSDGDTKNAERVKALAKDYVEAQKVHGGRETEE